MIEVQKKPKMGGEVNYYLAFNTPKTKGFGSPKEAINMIKEQNAREKRIDTLEAEAKKVGGIALWESNRIIKPGTVVQSGVDSSHKVLYSAQDMKGNTISLTDADMGTLFIKGISASMSSKTARATSKTATTKTASAKTTGTAKTSGKSASTSKPTTTNSTTGTKYPSGITTPAQKRAYTRAVNSGMSTTDAKKSALGKSTTAKSTTKTATKTSTKSTTKTSTATAKKTTSTTKASTPKKTTAPKKSTTTKASTTKKTATKKAEPKGKYTADNIPQVAGASKSIMKRTASLMNRGVSYDDAFDSALRSAGYGLGTRRGMFR